MEDVTVNHFGCPSVVHSFDTGYGDLCVTSLVLDANVASDLVLSGVKVRLGSVAVFIENRLFRVPRLNVVSHVDVQRNGLVLVVPFYYRVDVPPLLIVVNTSTLSYVGFEIDVVSY